MKTSTLSQYKYIATEAVNSLYIICIFTQVNIIPNDVNDISSKSLDSLG